MERHPVVGQLAAHRHRAVGHDDGDAGIRVARDDAARDGHARHPIGPPWNATMSGHTDGTVSLAHSSVPPSISAYAR